MHTHTHILFLSSNLGGRPLVRATAGPVVNDVLLGLLFWHPGSHTFPVIGYDVGPLASNARHTFIHSCTVTQTQQVSYTFSVLSTNLTERQPGIHVEARRSWFTWTCLLCTFKPNKLLNLSKIPSCVTRTRRIQIGLSVPPGFGSHQGIEQVSRPLAGHESAAADLVAGHGVQQPRSPGAGKHSAVHADILVVSLRPWHSAFHVDILVACLRLCSLSTIFIRSPRPFPGQHTRRNFLMFRCL